MTHNGGYYVCPSPCHKLHETIAEKQKCEKSDHGREVPKEFQPERKQVKVARRR